MKQPPSAWTAPAILPHAASAASPWKAACIVWSRSLEEVDQDIVSGPLDSRSPGERGERPVHGHDIGDAFIRARTINGSDIVDPAAAAADHMRADGCHRGDGWGDCGLEGGAESVRGVLVEPRPAQRRMRGVDENIDSALEADDVRRQPLGFAYLADIGPIGSGLAAGRFDPGGKGVGLRRVGIDCDQDRALAAEAQRDPLCDLVRRSNDDRDLTR